VVEPQNSLGHDAQVA
jgi:hypothetical protein